jgi:hypothetical protein
MLGSNTPVYDTHGNLMFSVPDSGDGDSGNYTQTTQSAKSGPLSIPDPQRQITTTPLHNSSYQPIVEASKNLTKGNTYTLTFDAGHIKTAMMDTDALQQYLSWYLQSTMDVLSVIPPAISLMQSTFKVVVRLKQDLPDTYVINTISHGLSTKIPGAYMVSIYGGSTTGTIDMSPGQKPMNAVLSGMFGPMDNWMLLLGAGVAIYLLARRL